MAGAVWGPAGSCGSARGGASRRGGGGAAWRGRERRDGRCARRGVAPFSPAWPGQPYPVRPVESVPGTQTPDTRHQKLQAALKQSFQRDLPGSAGAGRGRGRGKGRGRGTGGGRGREPEPEPEPEPTVEALGLRWVGMGAPGCAYPAAPARPCVPTPLHPKAETKPTPGEQAQLRQNSCCQSHGMSGFHFRGGGGGGVNRAPKTGGGSGKGLN